MAPNLLERFSKALRKNKADYSNSAASAPQPTPTPVKIGSLINQRYQLETEIGRGGMGIVYRAKDIRNEIEVAFKVINLHKTNSLTLGQFSREAQIAAQLNHPHIVYVYEVGTIDSGSQEPVPYIVMEFVRGTSLDNLHKFTYVQVIDLGKQICEALEYAHSQGFIHRDLKPGNILIEKHGFKYFAKLVDFGLASQRGATNLPPGNNLAGTVFYLAPEVIAGQPADVASDLYALGAMLYELVTGRVPFSNFFDDQAILAQHLEEPVAPPSHSRIDIPPALEVIILRLLAKDPTERFGSAKDVFQALDQVMTSLLPGYPEIHLPSIPPDFHENEKEINQGITLLEDSQLVTILGNQKNLGLAIATKLSKRFSDGVWFVDLEFQDDPSMVLPTVCLTLAIKQNPDRSLTVCLIEFLREKNTLLLLNHCHRQLAACALLVETIIETCPDVHILAISDKPLNIPFEKCYSPEPNPRMNTQIK